MTVNNLTPKEIAHDLKEHTIVLIDVREPTEYEAERIQGALLYPLSTFDPKALPEAGNRKIVLHCGSGMRSQKALAACQAVGLTIDSHMAGGIQAWKAAGLPTISINPATGNISKPS